MKMTRLAALFLLWSLVFAGLPLRGAGAADPLTRDPVFFVHGHGMTSGTWSSLIASLQADGYPSEFLCTIDLVPNDGPNQPAAEQQIAPAIQTCLDKANALLVAKGYTGPKKTKVDLLSHSMGGLSTRWYAARVAPERVDLWISIAGANHGTNALCPYVGDGGSDDSCPAYSSDPADTVQLTLNGQPRVADVDETPYGLGVDSLGVTVVPPDSARRIAYFTIRAEKDVWIHPDDSVVVDGAGGLTVALPEAWPFVETSPGNFLITTPVEHDPMPGDSNVKQLVTMLLRTSATPSCPRENLDPDDCTDLGDTSCDGWLTPIDAQVDLCLASGRCLDADLPQPCDDPSRRLRLGDWDGDGQITRNDAQATLSVFVEAVDSCDVPLGACCCETP